MADARAKYLITAQDKTKGATKSATKNFGGMNKAIVAVGAAAVLALGVKTVGAVKKLVTETATSLDDLAKSSNRLGVTVTALDSLNFSAELAGASAKDLETIYKRGARSIVDAADGIGEGKKALDRLGISAVDNQGNIKGIEQIILEFSDALPGLKSETELTATAMGLFGRSGQQIIPMLRQGSKAIRANLIEARVLGARTAENTRKGEDFIDAQLRLNRSMRATKDVISTALLPSLSALAESLAEKVIGLVTGLTREFRTFMATAQLEGPDVQIRLLNERLEESKRKIPELSGELAGLLETVKSGKMEAATVADDELRTVSVVRDELKLQEREEQEIIKALVLANQERTKALETQQRIRNIRIEEAEIAVQESKAQSDLNEAKLREKILNEDIAKSLADQTTLMEELSGFEMPSLDIDPLPNVNAVVNTLAAAENAAASVGTSISNDMGRALGQFVTTGQSGARVFANAWKSAIDSIAGNLASLALTSGLNALFPGLGFLGGILGKGINDGGDLTTALGKGNAGPIIIQQFQSLTPASTDDYNRANIAGQEAAARADRFLIVEG